MINEDMLFTPAGMVWVVIAAAVLLILVVYNLGKRL
jgi:uncharacterized membrane protein YdbT with pleckstrin-like domain